MKMAEPHRAGGLHETQAVNVHPTNWPGEARLGNDIL